MIMGKFSLFKRKLSQGWDKLGQALKLLNKNGLFAGGHCPGVGQKWDKKR
jgi:hypothetical protein